MLHDVADTVAKTLEYINHPIRRTKMQEENPELQHPHSLSDPPQPEATTLDDQSGQRTPAADLPLLGYDAVAPSDSAILLCALLVHSTVEAMNDAHNEYTVPWEDNKASIVAGVERLLKNPAETPEQNHAAWMAYKASEGWKYGPTKDEKAKTHPCLVPYEALGPFAKSKDAVFQALVRTMFGLVKP